MAPDNVPSDPLSLLRDQRPRVLADAAAFDRLARTDDVDQKHCLDRIRRRARAILDEPVSTYHIPDGKRLLNTSRRVVDRTMDLALVARIDDDEACRQRLWRELEACAAFADWNPSHFLDVAEMAHGFAIGYDWLFDQWTDEQRCTLREAIVRHAFAPAMLEGERSNWWIRAVNNWNVVCNGGLATAAVALGRDTPRESTLLIRRAVEKLPLCLQHFAPNGGWPEGPAYWSYTLRYLVATLSTFQAAMGGDFGLGDLPGLAQTGLFPLQMTGPSGRAFNFADAGESVRTHRDGGEAAVAMFLAGRYRRDDVLWDIAYDRLERPMAALWWRRAAPDAPPPPRAAWFRGVEAVSMRSAWDDRDALFVAAQCGRNVVGHNQADLGSFVLDALGQRWVIDPGTDDYNLPDFFGRLRYTYYRNRAEGHNVLVVAPDAEAGQRIDAGGDVTHFDADAMTCEMDLTRAYPGTQQVTRRISMTNGRAATVEDQVALEAPAAIWWFAHTRAKAKIDPDGRGAILEQAGRRLRVVLESPEDGRLTVMAARPLPTSPDPQGQNPNDGSRLVNSAQGNRVRLGEIPQWGEPDPEQAIRKLALHWPSAARVRIVVRFEPIG